MKNTVSSINNIQPAFGQSADVGFGKNSEPGSFVVCPPEKFYRFSIYDELKLDRDIHREFMEKLEPTAYKKQRKKSKIKKIISTIVKYGAIAGAGILAFKYRIPIKNYTVSLFDRIKRLF